MVTLSLRHFKYRNKKICWFDRTCHSPQILPLDDKAPISCWSESLTHGINDLFSIRIHIFHKVKCGIDWIYQKIHILGLKHLDWFIHRKMRYVLFIQIIIMEWQIWKNCNMHQPNYIQLNLKWTLFTQTEKGWPGISIGEIKKKKVN